MTSPTEPRRRDAGFTLLEIMVVVLLLGLIAGIVLQRGPVRSPTLDLRAAAEDIARTLRLARTRAIATNRPVTFRLDVAGHAFAVDTSPPRLLPASLSISMVAVAAGGPGAIRFTPDGSSSGGRVTLAEGARQAEIAVDWLTGRVTLPRIGTVDAQ